MENDLVSKILSDMQKPHITEEVIHTNLALSTKDWVQWSHIDCLRIPFIDELISHEPGRMVFDGYFYIDDAVMPVERVFHSNKGSFHVEIYEKKTIEDTSEFGPYDEEEGGHICFFPTAVIELKYRVIAEISDKEPYELWERIIQLEKVVKEREEHIKEEERKRYREEWEKEARERKEKEEQKNN
jgi:hypothetical protein